MRIRKVAIKTSIVVLFGLSVCVDCRKASAPPTSGTGSASSTPKKPVLDEKTQTVIADLVTRWDELRAFSASVATELPRAADGPGATKGKGTYEWTKRGDKRLIRFRLVNSLTIQTGDGRELDTHEILTFLYDGEFLYSQLQQPIEFKKTTKSYYKPDRILQIGGQELFQSLSETNSLKLTGDEILDGRVVYVIEATPVTGKGSSMHYFDEQSGARLKMMERDEAGKAKLTITLSNLNTSPEFSEDRFNYKLPEGFELIDKTKTEP